MICIYISRITPYKLVGVGADQSPKSEGNQSVSVAVGVDETSNSRGESQFVSVGVGADENPNSRVDEETLDDDDVVDSEEVRDVDVEVVVDFDEILDVVVELKVLLVVVVLTVVDIEIPCVVVALDEKMDVDVEVTFGIP